MTPVGKYAKFLHILIPANRKDPELCKLLASSQALNYPVPIILNWDEPYFDDTLAAGGWYVGRVKGVLDYLNGLPADRGSDLVIVPKAYDTWFQLRPGVLIERYLDINARANTRIEAHLGTQAVQHNNVTQRVVFAAQKFCAAPSDDIACLVAPPSTLPRYVYGKGTDGRDPLKARERYLDTALIMGEVKDLKPIFAKALKIMTEDAELRGSSDDRAFARILAEQEYQREALRRLYQSSSGRVWSNIKWFFGFEQRGVLDAYFAERTPETAQADSKLELGIGLDYEGLLMQSTVTAEIGSEWVRHNDSKKISTVRKNLKIDASQKITLPEDISRSIAPFWSPNGAADGFPRNQDWENVPLYTNLWTGNVPATIRAEASSEHTTAIRGTRWPNMWFQPQGRKMLDMYVNEPYKAFAVIKNGTHETAWWAMYEQKWAIKRQHKDAHWMNWGDICGDLHEEVFRDGKGPWNPPRGDY